MEQVTLPLWECRSGDNLAPGRGYPKGWPLPFARQQGRPGQPAHWDVSERVEQASHSGWLRHIGAHEK